MCWELGLNVGFLERSMLQNLAKTIGTLGMVSVNEYQRVGNSYGDAVMQHFLSYVLVRFREIRLRCHRSALTTLDDVSLWFQLTIMMLRLSEVLWKQRKCCTFVAFISSQDGVKFPSPNFMTNHFKILSSFTYEYQKPRRDPTPSHHHYHH